MLLAMVTAGVLWRIFPNLSGHPVRQRWKHRRDRQPAVDGQLRTPA
jgi:hypothetical protein